MKMIVVLLFLVSSLYAAEHSPAMSDGDFTEQKKQEMIARVEKIAQEVAIGDHFWSFAKRQLRMASPIDILTKQYLKQNLILCIDFYLKHLCYADDMHEPYRAAITLSVTKDEFLKRIDTL